MLVIIKVQYTNRSTVCRFLVEKKYTRYWAHAKSAA